MTAPAGAVQAVEVVARGADETRALGARLAALLRAGDVVVLSGDLGAGKTTFAQGVGAGLGVRGDVTSPTFVISRVHPSLVGGPALVHVDAYRLGGVTELDDLDLDETLDQAVTLVEWGDGLAETLAGDRLRVRLSRARGSAGGDAACGRAARDREGGALEVGEGDEPRTIELQTVGPRWAAVPLGQLVADTRRDR